jgi:rod shape-determining protein MreD
MRVLGIFWVALSMLIALMLTILPLPLWAAWFRPEWVLLVVIYWIIALPQRFNLGMAWCLGLVLDALSGTILGEHAMAMTIVAYVAVRQHRRIRVANIWQQSCTMGFFIALFQGIIFLIQAIVGQVPSSLLYWLPTITSMLFWPWIFIILRDWRRRFKIT